MSTSLLYHAFGIRGYQERRVDFIEGSVLFVSTTPAEVPLSRMRVGGSPRPGAHGAFLADGAHRPKPIFILLKVARVICFHCECTRQVKVPFADPRRTYTHAFERYALELSKFTTIQDTARHLGVSWDIIKDIQKRQLQRLRQAQAQEPQRDRHR